MLLHGYNSNEGDLFGLAPYLPLEPAIASLRAPIFTGYGNAWFPLYADGPELASTEPTRPPMRSSSGSTGSAPGVAAVGLLGFSQGGAMALELLRRAPDRFAFAVSLAGFALPGDRDGDQRMSELAAARVLGSRHGRRGHPRGIRRSHPGVAARARGARRAHLRGLGHSVSEPELADARGVPQRATRAERAEAPGLDAGAPASAAGLLAGIALSAFLVALGDADLLGAHRGLGRALGDEPCGRSDEQRLDLGGRERLGDASAARPELTCRASRRRRGADAGPRGAAPRATRAGRR